MPLPESPSARSEVGRALPFPPAQAYAWAKLKTLGSAEDDARRRRSHRGTEARYIAIAERDGKLEVILPYYRTRKVAVMTFRSEADLAALKAQAERQ